MKLIESFTKGHYDKEWEYHDSETPFFEKEQQNKLTLYFEGAYTEREIRSFLEDQETVMKVVGKNFNNRRNISFTEDKPPRVEYDKEKTIIVLEYYTDNEEVIDDE